MTFGEYIRIKALVAVLEDAAIDHSGEIIDDIIEQLREKIIEYDERMQVSRGRC